MRTAFYRVLTTLLSTSLLSIALVHASGTQPTSLNPPLTFHDFTSTITKGIYFIQFFSPECDDSCRAFAPTWKALVANYEMSDSVHIAQVDCSKDGDLCDNNGVKEYSQLNLYRDGRFVQTYHGSRDLELLTEYLSAAFRNPYSRPMVIPKSEGKVATLTLGNLAPTLAEGPAFVWFYPRFCHTDECRLLHPIWTQLAAHMRKWMTIAEVHCDAAEDPVSCAARRMRLSLIRTPTLVFYPPDGPAVTYLGPLTLAQLLAFIERGGVYPPAAMELTRETYWTMQAASVLVIAAAGTDPIESVAARIRGIAQEWYALHGGRTVQFMWEDPKRDHLGIARVLTNDVDVLVYIVDQEADGGLFRTEHSGERLKLTAASIFPVLEDVAAAPMLPLGTASKLISVDSGEGFAEQAKQYLYAAHAYGAAHPLMMLSLLSLSPAALYLVLRGLRRCLRAVAEVRKGKAGLLSA